MLDEQREDVHSAYRHLAGRGLSEYEHTEITALDRGRGLLVCRPAGERLGSLRPEDYLVVSVKNGVVVEGRGHANDVVRTHIAVYEKLETVSSIASGYLRFATVWAQARQPIPCLGVAHANRFSGPIPVTELIPDAESAADYRESIALEIHEAYGKAGVNHHKVPAVLVAQHGPFAFGSDCLNAAENIASLELIADIALQTLRIAPETGPLSDWKIAHHFEPSIFRRSAMRGQKPRIGRTRIG